MGTLHGRDYTYCRASDQKRQERHCHYFRRRSRRVRSRRPDRLAVIRQENEIKVTVREKSLVKIFHRASELLLNCFCFLMVAKPSPPPPPSAAPPPQPPPGWAVAAAIPPPDLGSATLYWWPDEGWQLERVWRRCRRAPFTNVVGYRTPTAAFAGEVATLLDPAAFGSRWVSLTRVAPSG